MRILFIADWYPYPYDNGSRIRYYNLLKFLSRYHQVDLLSFYTAPPPISRTRLQRMRVFCETVEALPRPLHVRGRDLGYFRLLARSVPPEIGQRWSEAMVPRVRRALAYRPDLVILAGVLNLPLLDHVTFPVPVILEEYEAATVHHPGAGAGLTKRCRSAVRAAIWVRYMRRMFPHLAGITVPSAAEMAYAQCIAAGNVPLALVPNGVDLDFHRADDTEPEPGTMIYQGSLEVPANYEAVAFFLNRVVPALQERAQIRLQVTGSTEGVALGSLARHHILELTGYLPDIRPAIRSAWLCVVPLQSGAGTRLKVLEAMALGTPVVATNKGVEGLDVVHGEHLLIGDEPDTFAGHVSLLLGDRALRRRLARNARRLVEEKYGWEQIGSGLNRFLERVARERRGANDG